MTRRTYDIIAVVTIVLMVLVFSLLFRQWSNFDYQIAFIYYLATVAGAVLLTVFFKPPAFFQSGVAVAITLSFFIYPIFLSKELGYGFAWRMIDHLFSLPVAVVGLALSLVLVIKYMKSSVYHAFFVPLVTLTTAFTGMAIFTGNI